MIASENGQALCVEALLKAGADMEATNKARQKDLADAPESATHCLL